jgi:hypothetical protein
MNSNSEPTKIISKSKKLELKSKNNKNNSKRISSKAKLSKSSKKLKTPIKSRSKSRTPKKSLTKSQNKKPIKEEEIDKRITIGIKNNPTPKSEIIAELPELKDVIHEKAGSKNSVIIKNENENNEVSQVYTQYPTQVIQNDQKTQSIINSQNEKLKPICSTDSKTKISKVPISMEGKKTTSKLNGNFEAKEESVAECDKVESVNATKFESTAIQSNNQKIIEENIYIQESQEIEGKKKDTDFKSYSSDRKKSNKAERDMMIQKSRSDCKNSKNINIKIDEETIQNVLKSGSNEGRSIVDLKNMEPMSLLRTSPAKETDFKNNIKEAKSKNIETETKQSE